MEFRKQVVRRSENFSVSPNGIPETIYKEIKENSGIPANLCGKPLENEMEIFAWKREGCLNEVFINAMKFW